MSFPGQVLSGREREYVLAARAMGGSDWYILWRHVVPNALAPIIVHTSLMIGQFMLVEASLAFLGLDEPNHISWGYLLRNAQPFLRLAWWRCKHLKMHLSPLAARPPIC